MSSDSKSEKLLNAFKSNYGEWVCSMHNSESGQPAATFRKIKNEGYVFDEISPNRWGKMMFCPVCGRETTHYRLLSIEPKLETHRRIPISPKNRKRILSFYKNKDAFTNATITSTIEIDHKIPWTRLNDDIDTSSINEEEIKNNFQLLTKEHNLLKDRACTKCKNEGIREGLFGINFWYDGNSKYNGTCEGCGWYDGNKWRDKLNAKLKYVN
jgi:hypothetical protein